MEVEAYKYHLEQIYHLCRMCEHKVKHTLAKQDVELLQQFDEANSAPPESSFSDWEDSFNCSVIGVAYFENLLMHQLLSINKYR